MAPGRGSGQDHGYRYERDGTDWQVDVEHPPPGQVVHEEPAEQRTDHARDPKDGTERALVPAPLARRDDVADDRLGAAPATHVTAATWHEKAFPGRPAG